MLPGVANGRSTALACALVGLVLAFPHGAFATPRAAELGPQMPLADPSGGYVGQLKVTPDHGPVCTPIAVTGAGFPPFQQFHLVSLTLTPPCKVTPTQSF